MNYYFRYFENESVSHSVDELISTIAQTEDIQMTPDMEDYVRRYCEESNTQPLHVKVGRKFNFIIIKTTTESLEKFHERGIQEKEKAENLRRIEQQPYDIVHHGIYKTCVTFKRVIVNPLNNKSAYVDEHVEAEVKGHCIRDCYDKIMDYIRNHPDVDHRSQLPSIKNSNFQCTLISEN